MILFVALYRIESTVASLQEGAGFKSHFSAFSAPNPAGRGAAEALPSAASPVLFTD